MPVGLFDRMGLDIRFQGGAVGDGGRTVKSYVNIANALSLSSSSLAVDTIIIIFILFLMTPHRSWSVITCQ
jgi:hypothetical protein